MMGRGSSILVPALAAISGASALGAVFYALCKGRVASAISGESRGPIKIRTTGYWPFTARDDEKKMEGGKNDRKGNPLHTLEDYLAGKSDHVSLSGDDSVWPYGQKMIVKWFDKAIVGRVTDTGKNFRGIGKVIRVLGYEPIDVCVLSRDTKVPGLTTATVIDGDHLDKNRGKAVAYQNLAQSKVAGDVLGQRGA